MRRVVSVWFPTLPTDRIRQRNPEIGPGPLVTVAQDGPSRILGAVDATALRLGLQAGTKLTEARVLVPGLVEHPADPDGDAALLRRLAEGCLHYAPLAAADPPDGLWIDVTGSTHLHGGEARLLHDLVRRMANQGLAARAAIADTPGLAHAVARFGVRSSETVAPLPAPLPALAKNLPAKGLPAKNHNRLTPNQSCFDGDICVVPAGATLSIIDDFPIEALRLSADICESFRRLGCRRVHQIVSIPRGPMARRFGKAVALRLDQATGRVFEPIVPLIPSSLIQARLGFVEPLLTAEAFATVINRLSAEVCIALEHAGQGARRLDLLFERVDGSVQALRTGTARSVRNPAHLARMLTERLEKIDPGLGVEAMRLIVAVADKMRAEQTATSLFEPPAPDLAPLVDVLTNRLGSSRVYRVAPVESHWPTHSVRRVPPLTSVTTTWPHTIARPVRLLDPPQPIEAMAEWPDSPPVAFTWRRVRHRVRQADGPERIGGEWWMDTVKASRDYFRVEDETGRRFWLFRDGDERRWFLHGFF